MKRLLFVLSCVLAVASCIQEEVSETGAVSYALSEVSLADEMNGETKSVFTTDDSQISSITLFAFDADGDILLYGKEAGSSYAGKPVECYSDKGGEIEWLLPVGGEPFDIYAVANLGDFRCRFDSLEELLDSPDMEWSSEALEDCNDVGIPMRGILQKVNGGQDYTLPMRRVVARFDLTLKGLDTGELVYFDICNINATVNVFGENEYAEAGDVVSLHEYATEDDINTLNAGGTVSFYVPENMQTTAGNYSLEPGHDWRKTAAELVLQYGLDHASEAECTYVDLWYREKDSPNKMDHEFLYLGDGRTNFDVERGQKKNLSVNVGFEGPIEEYIKIWISDGYRDENDLYVASNVCADIYATENYNEVLQSGFTLRAVNGNGEEIIRFSSPDGVSTQMYEARGVCVAAEQSDVTLEIYNSNGRLIWSDDENAVCVSVPGMIATRYGGRYDVDDPIEPFDSQPTCSINSNGEDFNIYLVDNHGYNLNTGYGIDASLLDFSFTLTSYDGTKEWDIDYISEFYKSERPGDEYEIAYAAIGIFNDGTDPAKNKVLSEMIGQQYGRCYLHIKENFTGNTLKSSLDVVIDRTHISIVTTPSEFSSMCDSEFMYKVKEPSKLPFTIKGVRFNGARMSQINSDTYVGKEGVRYGHLVLPSACSGWSSDEALFVNELGPAVFSLEAGSATMFEQDGYYYIPMDDNGMDCSASSVALAEKEIDWEGLPYIFDQNGLYHLLKFEPKYMPENCPHWLKVEPLQYLRTSDSYIYGVDGFREQGLTYYSCKGHSYAVEPMYTHTGTDFTEFGQMVTDIGHDIIEEGIVNVDLSFNENYELVAVASEPVTIEVNELNGLILSHIRTLVGHTGLYTVDCEVHEKTITFGSTSRSSSRDRVPTPSPQTTFELSSTPTPIDNGEIKEALETMRSQEYWSYWEESLGLPNSYAENSHYLERLKPYEIKLNLDITGNKAISVTYPSTMAYDYKKEVSESYWPVGGMTGGNTYQIIIPSSDSSVHSCDKCGGGEPYKEGIVNVPIHYKPGISTSTGQEIPQNILTSWDYPIITLSKE